MATYDYTSDGASSEAILEARTDPKAERIRWMLALPDLSRLPGSPVRHLLRRALGAPCLADADTVTFPEVVSVARNFDLLNAPSPRSSASPSATVRRDVSVLIRSLPHATMRPELERPM